MLSKSLISILALTSAVSASPALRRQADPCQDAYKSCIASGTPEVACSCTLTACVGEDNARIREYCASATANLPKTTAAPVSTSYACNPAHSYPNGAKCISTAGSLSLVTPAPSTTAASYACNPAHSYPAGAVCTQVGGTLTLVTPSSSATAASTTAAALMASGTNAAAPGSNPKKIDGKKWSLQNVNRYCGEGNTGCDYNFDIVANGKTEHCTVIRMPGSNAATESLLQPALRRFLCFLGLR